MGIHIYIRNTHTHKHKKHSQLSKQHKKALSLIPNIVNVDSTPTIIIVRAASRLYVDKRSIILGIRIDFIKLYTLSLHDGFRRAYYSHECVMMNFYIVFVSQNT